MAFLIAPSSIAQPHRRAAPLPAARDRSSPRSRHASHSLRAVADAPTPTTTTTTTPRNDLPAWQALAAHAAVARPHLRELLADRARCAAMFVEHDRILLDYSRQLASPETMRLLFRLADAVRLRDAIDAMFAGARINSSEDRAVLHTALRDGPGGPRPEVRQVLDKVRDFAERVRDGEWLGATGKPLTDVVSIGIGGSFLGPAFVHTALETEQRAQVSASGRKLRFLANVDPEDVSRALSGLSAETTLVIVVSKTFTTAETMLNARTVREWLVTQLGDECVAKHMVAVSTADTLVQEFGILKENTFGFWDWVGGRYSVSSAVGVLPLSLQYGYDMVDEFLAGMKNIDDHFRTAPFDKNIPVIMGLLSTWNATFLGLPANAILPYCQALSKLAPHIQQVSMESNGKGVSIDGRPLDYPTGEIIFGEPGTNGQHSFYQLIHQGRVVPCDFIGLARSQQSIFLPGELVSNHDELMSNFFAQADALALGKTADEVRAEGAPAHLVPHKTFTGNRPSLSLLLACLGPYEIGQVLALYEHRIAVQGFLWGINSFDQWGVELGKVLAKKMRGEMSRVRRDGGAVHSAEEDAEEKLGFNYSTTRMLAKYYEYCEAQKGLMYEEAFESPFESFIPCVGSDCEVEGLE